MDIQQFKDFFDEIYTVDNECGNKVHRYWIRIKTRGHFSPQYYSKHIFTVLPENDVVLIFSDQHQATWRIIQFFKKNEKNRIILIEEGVGTYAVFNENKSFKQRMSELIFGDIGEQNIGVSPLISSFIVKTPLQLPEIKKRLRPVIQQNTMFNDKQWIHSLNVFSEDAVIELSKYQGRKVLWLGQPLTNLKVSEEKEIRITNEILQCFGNQYSVIVKKHPRDRTEKYNQIGNEDTCKYFVNHQTWIPVEVLVAQIDPDIIITPVSSAALNLYDMGYGKRVIFCYQLFGLALDMNWLDPYIDNPDVFNIMSIEDLHKALVDFEKNPIRNDLNDRTINENKDLDYLNSLLEE